MDRTTDPTQVVRDYWQRIWIDGDLDALGDLVADPTIRHTVDGSHELSLQAFRQRISDALRTICGTELSIDSMAVDGPDVWARITLRGTTLATMSPLTVTWMAQYRVENDRISEMWALHHAGLDWND